MIVEEAIEGGWWPFWRRIYDAWPWDLPPAQFKVFVWMIGRARWGFEDDRRLIKGKFVTVQRGQFIMSIRKAGVACGVGTQVVRDTLKVMESDGMITRIRTQQGSLVTFNNYERYQVGENGREHTKEHNIRTTEEHSGNTHIIPGNWWLYW